MPDLQPLRTAAAALPLASEAPDARDEADRADFALGCECAYPVLQIERWLQESGAAAPVRREPH